MASQQNLIPSVGRCRPYGTRRIIGWLFHMIGLVLGCFCSREVGALSSLSSSSPSVTKCSYKNLATGRWKARQLMDDLKVGDELVDCYKIQELYNGKTGPKLFFECGIGRINAKTGKWQMVHGMMHLNQLYPTYKKKSVIRKKASKAFDKHQSVSLYVTQLLKDHGRMEVSTIPPPNTKQQPKKKMMISASSLQPGQEVEGTVVRIEPYGVFVNVGANRLGLLHISTVANLYGRYIPKQKGLVDAGLELGARIRVAVASNTNKKLALRFTDDVIQQSQPEEEEPKQDTTIIKDQSSQEKEEEEEEEDPYAWAAAAYADDYSDYADDYSNYSEDDFYYEDEDQDEDRDIEDALGIGTY